MIRIGEAGAADEAEVVAFWRACGLVVPSNDPVEDFRFAVAGPASAVLVGRDDDGVIGSVMVGHDGHRGVVYYVAAHPDRRLAGVGRAMVEAAEDWLRRRGVWKMNLLVRSGNEAVIGFYEALGYAQQPRAVLQKVLR